MNPDISVKTFISIYRERLQNRLETYLPKPDESPVQLHQAMRYAVLNGGKRIRPLLLYATGCFFKTNPILLDRPAVAIELIHNYSLVHDDLPAMDNDDFRRNQPTCHKIYTEATAILVGGALQSLAFELLGQENNPRLTLELAVACGSKGLAGGQQLDLEDQKEIAKHPTTLIHTLKTAALFNASVRLALLASQCQDEKLVAQFDQMATLLGLVFQAQDDLFDEGIRQPHVTELFEKLFDSVTSLRGGDTRPLQILFNYIKNRSS